MENTETNAIMDSEPEETIKAEIMFQIDEFWEENNNDPNLTAQNFTTFFFHNSELNLGSLNEITHKNKLTKQECYQILRNLTTAELQLMATGPHDTN